MSTAAADSLSIKRAAELIFRTSSPTTEQIQRIAELIAKGDLAGNSRGTTADAVADFIARAAIERQSNADAEQRAPRPRRGGEEIEGIYRQSLKQYFLAVILQKKVHKSSKQFQRAVLAGQIGLLATVLVIVLISVRTVFPPLAPERAAVVQWLEDNTDEYRIIKFHPTTIDERGDTVVGVEYSYITPQGRGIDTRRVFKVVGDQVSSVDDGD